MGDLGSAFSGVRHEERPQGRGSGSLLCQDTKVSVGMTVALPLVVGGLLGGYIQKRVSSDKLKPLVCGVLLVFRSFFIAQAATKF